MTGVAWPQDKVLGVTGADGAFRLESLAEGTVDLAARHGALYGNVQGLEVKAGETLTSVVITLRQTR